MDNMTIRHARRDELYEIAVFLDECWKGAYKNIVSDDYLSNMSADKRHSNFVKLYDNDDSAFLMMLDKNGNIVGAAVYGKSITDGYPDDGEITAIYINENYIGKGYGHKLFTKAEELLSKSGYANFVVDVFTENKRAVEFYLKHGYNAVAERTLQLGDNEYPILVLRKKTMSKLSAEVLETNSAEIRFR